MESHFLFLNEGKLDDDDVWVIPPLAIPCVIKGKKRILFENFNLSFVVFDLISLS